MSLYSLCIRLFPEALRISTGAAIAAAGGAYIGIGTTLDNPSRILYLLNGTDVLLLFSYDGITDHQALPSNGFLLLDVSANSSVSQGFFIAQGQRIYVRYPGAAPTTGSVYLSTYYGAGGTI